MSDRPFFSILIPVYNVEPYVGTCLDSILSQGFTDYELVVVDDGATDRSGAICDGYAARDARVRVFHKENGGLMSARRYAIARAKGEYLLFADSDDSLLPGALDTLADTLRQSGADCVIYGARCDAPGGVLHAKNPGPLCGTLLTDRRQVVGIILSDSSYNALWRKCARASCFDGRDFSPWFHVSRGEDLLQSTEILENARSFLFLPDELYLYRYNHTSITHSVRFDGYRADFSLDSFVYDWLRRLDFFEEEDYTRYRNGLLDTLVVELKRICRACPDRADRNAALASIRDAAFYRDFLETGYRGSAGLRRAFNRRAVGLLNQRRYDALAFFCTRVYRR